MPRHLRLLAAAAMGCGLGVNANAQHLSLSGLVDMSAGRFQNAGADGRLRVESGQMSEQPNVQRGMGETPLPMGEGSVDTEFNSGAPSPQSSPLEGARAGPVTITRSLPRWRFKEER